jgi:GT2 family glycosyltransferase
VLVFLNPDGKVTADALAVLIARASADRRSIFGPAFLHEDGDPRHDMRRRSRLYHEPLELLPASRRWMPERLRRDIPDSDNRYTTGGVVDYLQGACLAIDRLLFHELGGFDEDFFLYSEEETLCDAVRAAGGFAIYVPEAVIEHVGGTSTGRVSEFAVHHFYRSRVIFYRKRYGLVGGLSSAVLTALGLLVNGMFSPLVQRYSGGDLHFEAHSAALSGLVRGVTATLRR